MSAIYPYAILDDHDDIVDDVAAIDALSCTVEAELTALESEARGTCRADAVLTLTSSLRFNFEQIGEASKRVGEYITAAETAHRDYEAAKVALDKLQDTDDGQAVRALARDMAAMIDKAAAPAFRAITELQNKAAEMDAMVRRARDMAGCLRAMHSPDRDPLLPEVGSLTREIAEALDPRTAAFSAAIHRARVRQGISQGVDFDTVQSQADECEAARIRKRRMALTEAYERRNGIDVAADAPSRSSGPFNPS